jgi:anthranilate synthase component 2
VTRVCFIDNFDSFTYNLVEYVSQYAETEVLRNTASLDDVRRVDPDAIVISPGPGHPKNDRDVGVTLDVLTELTTVPTLGVCLGLEAAVYAYGGTVGHAPIPIHGKAFPIEHDGSGVFTGLENPLQGGRYHSLVASEVPDCFNIVATTQTTNDSTDHTTTTSTDHTATANTNTNADAVNINADADASDIVMGIRHREHPIECVQFHPESVLTSSGHALVRNFLTAI